MPCLRVCVLYAMLFPSLPPAPPGHSLRHLRAQRFPLVFHSRRCSEVAPFPLHALLRRRVGTKDSRSGVAHSGSRLRRAACSHRLLTHSHTHKRSISFGSAESRIQKTNATPSTGVALTRSRRASCRACAERSRRRAPSPSCASRAPCTPSRREQRPPRTT